MTALNPVLVSVERGGVTESWHRGAAAVADAEGRIVAQWGDIDRAIYPRSTVKPLQAIPLLESGAADRFRLDGAALALACASHSGEARHVERVAGWLARLGLTVADLICGPQEPFDDAAWRAMVRSGDAPSALHNNCSGKHAGMLTTAVHLGEPTRAYGEPDHPVQRRIAATLSAMTGIDVGADGCGIDGCAVPTWPVPLRHLAHAYARVADPDSLPTRRAATIRRLTDAIVAYPHLLAGSDRFDTTVVTLTAGAAVTKSGAEGVRVAALRTVGLGIALKIDDGQGRAADAMMAALIGRFGRLSEPMRAGLRRRADRDLVNSRAATVGRLCVAAEVGG